VKHETTLVESSFPRARRATVAALSPGAPVLETTLQRLRGRTHWHFATHGGFDAADPLASFVYLDQAVTLTADQIFQRRLELGTPRLVFLSACETGRTGSGAISDEFIGMPMALLSAGVPNVIASLWQVSDFSTALLSSRFYEAHIEQGMDPASALRLAQIWLRDSTSAHFETYLREKVRLNLLSQNDLDRARSEFAGASEDRPFSTPNHWAAWVCFGA
jgi:CHAT domain-containing protein